MKLPGLPAVRFGLVIIDFARLLSSGVSSWIFVGPSEKDDRSTSRADGTDTAKQQCKKAEQAFASSGNQTFLGHRSAPVSSYSPEIIARTAGGRWRQIGLERKVRPRSRVSAPLPPQSIFDETHPFGKRFMGDRVVCTRRPCLSLSNMEA